MKTPVITSFYGPLKDPFVYIKRKRAHIIDLDDNFKTLSLRHGNLLAVEEHIERKLIFKTKNNKYSQLRRQIQDITRKYERYESRFKKWGGNISTQVATNENVANGGEGGTSSTQGETNETVASGGEGNMSSTQVAQDQHIGQRKIWTWKFFKNAKLDKDVLKLTGEINALKIEDVRLETLVAGEF